MTFNCEKWLFNKCNP